MLLRRNAMKAHIRRFSLSTRYILMKSFAWVGITAIIVGIVVFSEVEEVLFSRQLHLFSRLKIQEFIFYGIIGGTLLARALHAYLRRKYFSITITDHALNVSQGILLRRHTSIPLEKITQVNIGRDFVHLLFGLYFLEICFPAGGDDEKNAYSLRIDGLGKNSAKTIRGSIQRFFPGRIDNHKRVKATIPERRTAELVGNWR